MKCPDCRTRISEVVVSSHIEQMATLDGKRIVAFDSLDERLIETVGIVCPDCGTDLRDALASAMTSVGRCPRCGQRTLFEDGATRCPANGCGWSEECDLCYPGNCSHVCHWQQAEFGR